MTRYYRIYRIGWGTYCFELPMILNQIPLYLKRSKNTSRKIVNNNVCISLGEKKTIKNKNNQVGKLFRVHIVFCCSIEIL